MGSIIKAGGGSTSGGSTPSVPVSGGATLSGDNIFEGFNEFTGTQLFTGRLLLLGDTSSPDSPLPQRDLASRQVFSDTIERTDKIRINMEGLTFGGEANGLSTGLLRLYFSARFNNNRVDNFIDIVIGRGTVEGSEVVQIIRNSGNTTYPNYIKKLGNLGEGIQIEIGFTSSAVQSLFDGNITIAEEHFNKGNYWSYTVEKLAEDDPTALDGTLPALAQTSPIITI
ncbi:hypothetical protein OAI07_01335 [Akkermansiaceae bacterium]|nr:hypothetical protein [Akkermansiaceae bacterium]